MFPTKKGKYNRQHVFLWLALATLSFFVLFITIYLITGGKNKESLAQNDFTFTEDFTTSDNLDAGVTNVQLDGSAGEASLYNGYWTHITDRGVIGHEDTPEWLDPAQEEFSGGQALKINPVNNEPYLFFVVAKPGFLPKEDKLYFSRYDRADKRWEKMDGTPGREDLSALFPSPSHMYQITSSFGNLVKFNAAGDPYLLVNRRAGTSPFLFSPWFLRWCPSLSGGSWGNAACSAVGPESLDIPGIHDLATGLALDSSGRPHATFYDGTSSSTGCPAFNVKITDLNGGSVDPGDVLEYKIVIKNRAGKAVSGAAITSEMPQHVHGFTVVSTTLAGITDSSSSSGGSNSTGLLDISNISLPSNGSGEIVYRVTVDNPIVLPPSPPPPPTKLVNDYTLTRGLNINTRTKTLTVGSPNTTTPGSLACNTGQFYSFFDGSIWVNTTGGPGAENNNPYSRGGSLDMDPNDNLYLSFVPFTANISSSKKIMAEVRDANSTTAQFKALVGGGPWTQVTNDFGLSFFTLSSDIEPGSNRWHLIWNSKAQDKMVHTAWNPATGQFEKMDGSPGEEILPALKNAGEFILLSIIKFSSAGGAPSIFTWNFAGVDRNFHYLKWDPSLNQWRTHINNSLPETITPEIPGSILAAFAVDNNNAPYISYADASFIPGHKTIKITTFTPEAVDVTRNVIASKDIDQTDEPIVKAKISWQGESRGYAGGSQAAQAQPFSGANGRNAYVDVDCSLSNDAGLNWYPVNFHDDFVFPRLGTSLRYKCLLDSGTLLDDPVIKNLTINYSTGRKAANLVMTKNVDTNQDGVFLDQGDQVLPGSELTYQIKVTNNGTSSAQDVSFRDQIPAGTTYVPGSTTVDGQAVADQDGKAPFLPPVGLDLGSLPGKNLFQLTWDRGGGQSLFGDLAKFWSAQNIDFSAKEILRALVNFIRQDDSFAPAGSSLKLSAGSATNWAGLSGAVKLSNGQYFAAWKDLIAGNIVGRFFDQDGNPKTGLITISDTPSTGNSLRPVARQLSGGDIVVAWTTVGGGTARIVMNKLDAAGNVLNAHETVLASEAALFAPTISLDRLSFAAQAHSSIVTDSNNNFYLGLARKKSGDPCPQKAEVAKFDNAGNALWGPVVVSGAACDVMEAPVLAINSSGELMSVHTTNTFSFLHTVSAIVANVLDANGNVLGGSTTINSNNLFPFNSGVRSVASLNNHDFVVSYVHNNGSCVGACLQKITYNSGTISFDSPVLIDSSADRHIVVAADQSDQIIVALWLGADGRFHAQAFDFNLAPLGGSYSMPLGFSGYTQDYPSMALDQVNNKIWAVWQESDYDDLIVGNVLNYGPVPHELVSSVYDAGAKTDWQTIKTTTKIPSGSNIKIQVRAGNTGAPDSTWTPFVDVPLNGNLPGSLHGYRFVQYKVIFELIDLSAKPELHDIFIGQAGQRAIEFKVRVNAGTNAVISNLASAGLGSGGSTVNSQSTANQVGPPTLQELYGDNRIDTAVAISQSQFAQDSSADCAILVRADDPIESLTGAPLAAQCGGPILLNPTTHLDSRNIQELKRILAAGEPIYLLGREKALALSLANELAREGFTNVIRRGGRNREATAVEIAKELDRLEPDALGAAFIANGFKFADPVSAAPAAATKEPGSTRSPILLIKSTGVIKEVKDFLTQRPDIKTVYVIGGQAVAPDNITDFLAELVSKPTKIRIAGTNRFDTSVKVAERFFPVPVRVFVTSGFGFPVFDAAGHPAGIPVDALVSGPLAAKQGAPVLFAKRSKVPGEIDAYLKTHKGTVGELTLIGGPNAIIPAIRQALFDLIK